MAWTQVLRGVTFTDLMFAPYAYATNFPLLIAALEAAAADTEAARALVPAEWYRTGATGTVLSGAGTSGGTLAYTPGQEILFKNGLKLIPGVDYTRTSSSVITLAVAAVAGDKFHLVTWVPSAPSFVNPVSVADATAALHAMNRQSGDARYLMQTGGSVSGALAAAGGLSVGGGASILKILRGSTTYDIPSLAADNFHEFTMTVTGARQGDDVIPGWPLGFTQGWLGMMRVTGDNTVTGRVVNLTGASSNPSSILFTCTVLNYSA